MSIRQRFLRVVVLAGLAALLLPEMTPATVHASTPLPGLVFHTIDPCRVVDTRVAGGPVVAGVDRTFAIVGPPCGVPATARAVSLNLAVTQPTASGNVRLFPADAAVPTVSSINYAAGQTRSNNAVIGLSAAGELKARAQPAGSVHVILDVNGYFAAGPSFLGCDSPADGAYVDLVPGAGFLITGTAVGLSDVRVNGAPVVVAADNTFSATVTGRYGLNFVELSAIDGGGAAQTRLCAFLGAQRWATEGAQFEEALMFRLEPQGLQKLMTRYPLWFAGPGPQALDSSLATNIGHAVIGNCSGFGTCADIQYLSVSAALLPGPAGFSVSVTNQQTLNVRVTYDISLHLRASGKEFGVPQPTITGDALFDNATVSVDVNLYVDPVSGLPYVSGNPNDVSWNAADWSQFNGLGPTVRGMVVSFVEAQLASSLGSVVFTGSAGLFEGLFAGMDVAGTGAGFPVGRLDGTGNVTVALARRHSVALINAGFSLHTGLRVTAPPPDPTGRIPLPPFDDPIVPPHASDAWSSVHAGVFNQVLQALWRADLFDGTVDGAALGPGLPAGTSVSAQLGTMPVVTGFDPGGATRLDVGALHLLVTHPDLPPGLSVTAGGRIRAQAALVADDLLFDGMVVDELHVSTGAVTLDAASRATLDDLVQRVLVKVADIALNDSLPVVPEAVFTIPPSLGPYGLPVGSQLVGPPSLVLEPNYAFLEGLIGF
jgi:hypothetical protein